MDITLYIVIAILISIIIGMIIYHATTVSSYEKRIGQYIKRYMVNDVHHKSKENFLTLLLLETKGVNTGVKSRAALYRDFKEEVTDNLNVIKYGKGLVKEKIYTDKTMEKPKKK